MYKCKFVIPNESRNSILNYYIPKTKTQEYSELQLRSRFIYLIGKKNISIDAAASDEFYDFIIYCIAFGISIGNEEDDCMSRAKQLYHHFHYNALHDSLLAVARDIKNTMIRALQKLTYVSISIDEGSSGGVKNLDFNAECPLSDIAPFTLYTEIMYGQTTDDYVPILLNGLSFIQRQRIQIASVICDGNTAQKKAFSFKYKKSLRFLPDYPWIKKVYFIPCLCHRTNNAFKNVIIHNDSLNAFVQTIHNIADECKTHKDELGKVCPTFVSTRWVYDYDIALFITKHSDEIKKWIPVPDGIELFLETTKIFKILIKTFENPSTPFYSVFRTLEKAVITLNHLHDASYPYIEEFKTNLLSQTLESDEGGLWILGHLFTANGHDDFYNRFQHEDLKPPDEPLDNINIRYEAPEDPIEQEMEYMIEKYFETITNEEEEDAPYQEDDDMIDEEEDYEGIRKSPLYINKAKISLSKLLTQEGYQRQSHKTLMKEFNAYLDAENPFPHERTSNDIGFSWLQIRRVHPTCAPIANIALKLLHSGISEASCERTISAQRLIFNARRRSSDTSTLEARLTIMRSEIKNLH